MKKLILITGAPGVGKSTICKELFSNIQGCAWLDSDWCWMVNPWQPKSIEQKNYVEDNFGRILKGYFINKDINIIIFSWVMNKPTMFQIIIDQLDGYEFETIKIALVCDKESHIQRMINDNRREDQVNNPHEMTPYYEIGANVVDISNISPSLAVAKIIRLILN